MQHDGTLGNERQVDGHLPAGAQVEGLAALRDAPVPHPHVQAQCVGPGQTGGGALHVLPQMETLPRHVGDGEVRQDEIARPQGRRAVRQRAPQGEAEERQLVAEQALVGVTQGGGEVPPLGLVVGMAAMVARKAPGARLFGTAEGLADPSEGFVIEAVGTSSTAGFSDEGIEYYAVVQ